MIDSLNSRLYTIPVLREIAAKMGVILPAKATKLSIAQYIVVGIESAHAEALEMNAQINAEALDEWAANERMADNIADMVAEAFPPSIEELDEEYREAISSLSNGQIRQANRVNAYMRQRGTDKLTPAQWRRIRKNSNKHGVKLATLALTYP